MWSVGVIKNKRQVSQPTKRTCRHASGLRDCHGTVHCHIYRKSVPTAANHAKSVITVKRGEKRIRVAKHAINRRPIYLTAVGGECLVHGEEAVVPNPVHIRRQVTCVEYTVPKIDLPFAQPVGLLGVGATRFRRGQPTYDTRMKNGSLRCEEHALNSQETRGRGGEFKTNTTQTQTQ